MNSSTVQSLVWGPNVAQKQIYFWPLTYFFTIFKASLINHFWSPTHIVSVSVSVSVSSVRSPVLSGSSSSSTWNSSTLSRSVCSSASGKASWEMCLWGSPAKRWQMNLTMWNRIFHRMNFFFFSFKWSFLGWLHWKKTDQNQVLLVCYCCFKKEKKDQDCTHSSVNEFKCSCSRCFSHCCFKSITLCVCVCACPTEWLPGLLRVLPEGAPRLPVRGLHVGVQLHEIVCSPGGRTHCKQTGTHDTVTSKHKAGTFHCSDRVMGTKPPPVNQALVAGHVLIHRFIKFISTSAQPAASHSTI